MTEYHLRAKLDQLLWCGEQGRPWPRPYDRWEWPKITMILSLDFKRVEVNARMRFQVSNQYT